MTPSTFVNFVGFSPFFEFRCLKLRFHNQFCHNKGQAGWDQGYHIGWIYWHSGSLLHDEWTVQDHKCYEGLRGVFVQGKVPHLHKTDKRMLKKGEEGSLSPTQGVIKYSLLDMYYSSTFACPFYVNGKLYLAQTRLESLITFMVLYCSLIV